ncbi:ALPHA-MANNOSIDASE domain protein, partial [Mycobacterium xenopi 3993]
PVVCSSSEASEVRAYHGPLGQRLVIRGRIGPLLRYTQTLTLWHGIARVDCRTRIDEFTGTDQLLRLRWPCPWRAPCRSARSATPSWAEASRCCTPTAGGGHRTISLDAGQPGLRLVRAVLGGAGAGGDAVRAVSVAEVVSPTETTSGPLARALMIALVRAGVTATCSGADKSRYGHLGVDSNLPDTRVALGGPTKTCSPKRCWPRPTPPTAPNSTVSSSRPPARVWVPPSRRWPRPGCPARPARATGAAGAGDRRRDDSDLAAAVAALTDDLADAEVVVSQQVPASCRVRGANGGAAQPRVPSFAVDTDGTCTPR